MNDDSLKQIHELVDQLLDLSPQQRNEKLDQLKQDQHPLHEQIKQYLNKETLESSELIPSKMLREKPSMFGWLLPPAMKQSRDSRANDLRELAKSFDWDSKQQQFTIGNYQIGRCLSFNSQSANYFAHDKALDRKVVLMLAYPRIISRLKDRNRFISSAKIISAAFHPNVASVLGVIEQTGQNDQLGLLGIVRQWIAGDDLATWLTLHAELPLNYIALITKRIAQGLSAIHAIHALHGDINLTNIIIRKDSLVPVIIDFGTVFTLRPESSEQSQWIGGTPGYIAPEILRNSPYDSRIDIYSLGIVLRDLLKHADPTSQSTEHYQQLRALSDQLTAEDPDKRPRSCDDIIPQLSLISGEAADQSNEESISSQLTKKPRNSLVTRRLMLLTASTALPFFAARERQYFFGANKPTLPFIPGTIHDSNLPVVLKEQADDLPCIKLDKPIPASVNVPELPELYAIRRYCFITIPPFKTRYEISTKPVLLPHLPLTANVSNIDLYFNAPSGEVSFELLARNINYSQTWYTQAKKSNYIDGPAYRGLVASMDEKLLKPGTEIEFRLRMLVQKPWDGKGRPPIMLVACQNDDNSIVAWDIFMWTKEF